MIPTVDELLEHIRSKGYVAAVHNDYRQDGKLKTFWLFTHKNGTYVKGEGDSDVEALGNCCATRIAHPHTIAPSPEPDGGCPYWDLKVNEYPDDPENHCSCNFSVIKAGAAKAAREQFADEAITKITLELNDTDRKWKGMMRSIEIIDSLRHQPEPQQEGRR